jgi:hypothetical protein
MRSGVVGVTLGSLNHTTEEIGRLLFGLTGGDTLCDLRVGEGEWRLPLACTRLKDLACVSNDRTTPVPKTVGVLGTDGVCRGANGALCTPRTKDDEVRGLAW